jgi:hypothetical protein
MNVVPQRWRGVSLDKTVAVVEKVDSIAICERHAGGAIDAS